MVLNYEELVREMCFNNILATTSDKSLCSCLTFLCVGQMAALSLDAFSGHQCSRYITKVQLSWSLNCPCNHCMHLHI